MTTEIIPQSAGRLYPAPTLAERRAFDKALQHGLDISIARPSDISECCDEYGRLVCDHAQCHQDAWEAASGN